jgi:uncharacterized SAM-binding protein YcdF (DUF218 family)
VKKMDSHLHALAEKLWSYHLMNHRLERADAILVLCSHDLRVAETGARLFLEGWASLIIFSGGLGVITRDMWSEPEADQFAKIAKDMGVPEERILIENRSTNTGENISFTKALLAEQDLNPEKFILVQKPYMERRSYATFRKLWPEKEVLVTSPQVGFDEYLDRYANSRLTGEDVIDIMVGDLQRIKVYAEKGFQIQQEIPDDVWSAYEELVAAGFSRRLIET